MIKTIKKFNEIEIIPNSLVVLDIDETILKFDGIDMKWWKNKFNKNYIVSRDYKIADKLTYYDWIKIISRSNPELVDNNFHNFINLITENNCELILLTARSVTLKNITLEHLNQINFSFNEDKIYFNENKGDELNKIINEKYLNMKNIIVVDDAEPNLYDIKEKIPEQYNLYLYKMII